MSRFLITGVSDSGKTTIATELRKLGLKAIDMSSIKHLSSWVDENGVQCKRPANTSAVWFNSHCWEWNLTELENLLRDTTGSKDLFLCGNSINMADAYHYFDSILYLKIKEAVILQRLQDPSRSSDFGQSGTERQQIIDWIKILDMRMAEISAITIDGNQPIKNVVASILNSTKALSHDNS